MKQKFKYDPENLQYRRIYRNFRAKFFRALTWVLGSLFLAIVFNSLYAAFFDTPAERQVRQENKALKEYYDLLMRRFVKIDTVLNEIRSTDEDLYRTIFETEPTFRENNEGKSKEIPGSFSLVQADSKVLVSTSADRLNNILTGVNRQAGTYTHIMNMSIEKQDMLTRVPAIQPLGNSDLSRLAAGYGVKIHPSYRIKKMHYGIDFIAPTGTEVYATGNGVVEDLVRTKRGNGNTITIDHGNGYKTIYSYLENFNVRFGQEIKRGQVIGWVGNTELSIAPHLHYEVHLNGQPVNPVHYFFLELTPEEYTRVCYMAAKTGQSFD